MQAQTPKQQESPPSPPIINTSPPITNSSLSSSPTTISSITHNLLLMVLESLMVSTVLLAGPFYWYWVCGEEYRRGWYDLVDHLMDCGVVWQIEVTRWSLFLLHILLQFILSHRITRLVPQIIAKLAKWSAELSSSSSSTIQNASELFVACIGHTFNFLSSISLYLITIHLFYREETDRTWQYFLERTILMVVLALGAILLEKILLHVLAIEFNRSLYQDRVFKSMYNQWILATLRNFLQHSKQLNGPNASIKTAKLSSWARKVFPHRNSDDLMAAFLLDNPTNTPSNSNTNNTNTSSATSKASRKHAKDQLVKEIFAFFDPNSTGFIELSHLDFVFEQEDSRKTFKILSNNSSDTTSNTITSNSNSTGINRDTLRKAFLAINKDRWDLSRALTTHASIIKKLDRVMIGFIFAVILYFSPIIGYQLDKGNVFNFGVTLAPLIISFTEFFGDSIKRICEAIIYVVTCHPYDVGDRVSIDGVDFFVHEIGLVSTTFKRFDGFFVWIPNYVLARKALCNIRRTGMQGQRLECQVDASVSMEKLQSLSNSIKEFIRNDTKDFEAVSASFFDLQQDQNRIVLVFLLKHRLNFQDGIQRGERQSRFLLYLRELVSKLDIEYRPPVLRSLIESDLQIKNHLYNIFENQDGIGTNSRSSDPFTSL